MKVEQVKWTNDDGWNTESTLGSDANLVTVFGGSGILDDANHIKEIKDKYPSAIIVGCSTAGEISDINVDDGTLSVTAISFEKTQVKAEVLKVDGPGSSENIGKDLVNKLLADDLSHVFVLSDGLGVNGSKLVEGLNELLPENVVVTGGLAGDGANFKNTKIIYNDQVLSDHIVAVGFYGKNLQIGYASMGGWDKFGVLRNVTKSKDNVLYELDGEPALDLYKNYLGEEKAAELPASALLFPLALKNDDGEDVVRTILAVDEETKSMTFAGNIPEGGKCQFMKANFNRLIEAASGAANDAGSISNNEADLAILISCVGRKLILNQRIEEEVEAVRDEIGDNAYITGFYSYGEISPFSKEAKCHLHNQTMTITTFKEV